MCVFQIPLDVRVWAGVLLGWEWTLVNTTVNTMVSTTVSTMVSTTVNTMVNVSLKYYLTNPRTGPMSSWAGRGPARHSVAR